MAQPGTSQAKQGPARLLRQREFRLFLTGQGISQTGTWLQFVALAWLTVQLTGSGSALGWVTAATFGPLLLLGPWAGLFVDRHDTLRVLRAVQAAMVTQRRCWRSRR